MNCRSTSNKRCIGPKKCGSPRPRAELIRDGETVILDSGTTTTEIAKQIRTLKLASINVITNALNIAVLLANSSHVNVIIPGGVLRQKSLSLSGPQAEQALSTLHADVLFLGVDSLDPQIGLMTPYVLEAQLNAQMIRISQRVVAVTDSSKLLRRNLSVIAPVDQMDVLITDSGADAACIEAIRARSRRSPGLKLRRPARCRRRPAPVSRSTAAPSRSAADRSRRRTSDCCDDCRPDPADIEPSNARLRLLDL